MSSGTGRRGWLLLPGLVAALAGSVSATSPRGSAATPLPVTSPPAAAATMAQASLAPPPVSGPLHVPSPDWRDQVIYFLMTDRFDDGDPGNNDQGAGEYAADDPARYNGGDLAGVERRLDYIRGLGATALWLTPPVLNRWWDPVARHGGYHGYWASDFMRVDPHLGALADYQRLSRKLHGAGMYLVQDIVLNHTGNWFDYAGGWSPTDPAAHFRRVADHRGANAPAQWPFSQNDARDPAQRRAGIYHWTPNVVDFTDPAQVLGYQMGGLDDLNSENPVVRDALRRSHGYWIAEAGVDAFRLDTILYVPPASLDDFLYADDPAQPGIAEVARRTGRKAFHVFGEGFAIDKPFEETQARRIEALTRRADGSTLVPGMINFPLYGSLVDVFARGRPTAELGYRLASMMRVHAHPELMPTFVDNHDVDRFLSGGDEAGLRQALLAMMTLPGIPTLYYGTEQGFTVPRAAMFAAGSDSGGRDHFDTGAPLYRFIQRTTALRREHRLFSRGRPAVLRDSGAGPGVFAYRMQDGDASALVVFNTSASDALLDNLETGLAPGARLEALFDIGGEPRDQWVGGDGRLSLVLPPRSGQVWRLPPRSDTAQVSTAAPAAPRAIAPDLRGSPHAIALDAGVAAAVAGDFDISGRAPGLTQLQLVVDGDLGAATAVPVAADGRWRARIDTSRMMEPGVAHRVAAWSAATGVVSPAHEFRVTRAWQLLADVADPANDDHGRSGRYLYPTDASWSGRSADLRRVRIEGAGGALRISLQMDEISRRWNPPNGFDHVAFSIHIELPGAAGGVPVVPLQNAELPGGMRWHRRLRSHGWSNALFAADGATARSEGRVATPAAGIEVDAAARTVSFTLSAAALGGGPLSGARIHVGTWDYDGGFRPLTPAPGGASFGGGDADRDPLLMDESPVITLP